MEGILTSPLLNLIAERHLADPQDLEAIQGEHNMSGAAIPKLLHDQGVLDTASQLELVAEYLGTDVIDITAIEFSSELLELIPMDVAKNYQCLPIGLDGETLHLCMADPLNPTALDDLAYQLKRPLQLRIADSLAISKLIDDKYSDAEGFGELIEAMGGADGFEEETAAKPEDDAPEALEILEEVGDEAPIVRFVNMVLYLSLIHI